MQFRILSSDEIRQDAARFNDQWRRSRVALPTARAEHVLHWHKAFGREKSPLQAAVVEHDGVWLAALAFTLQQVGPFQIAELPTNPWQPSGELLVDEALATPETFGVLLEGLRSQNVSIFDLGIVLPGTNRWQALVHCLEQCKVPNCIVPRFEVALVDAASDWQAQNKTWSTNHRKRVKRNQKLLEANQLEVCFHSLSSNRESIALLDEMWRLEALSWKGEQGDAVAGDAKLVDFYREQALLLAEAGDDEVSSHVAILKRRAQPVAAMYYWLAKNVCHLWKTGYDPAFAELSPGSLLLQEVLRSHIERGDVRLFNLMGEMSCAHASFATRKFAVARLLFAGNSGLGCAAVAAYRALRRLRGRPSWQGGEISEPWPISQAQQSPGELSLAR